MMDDDGCARCDAHVYSGAGQNLTRRLADPQSVPK